MGTYFSSVVIHDETKLHYFDLSRGPVAVRGRFVVKFDLLFWTLEEAVVVGVTRIDRFRFSFAGRTISCSAA